MGQIDIIELLYRTGLYEKLFILFLIAAFCIIVVRFIRLLGQLWSLHGRKEFSDCTSRNVDKVAKAALKGAFVREPTILYTGSPSDLDFINAKFRFFWETCHARVRSTKTLAALTAVLSLAYVAAECVKFFIDLEMEHVGGIAPIVASRRYAFFVLEIGLFVSAFFYSISLLFEAALARRQRDWNYLKWRIERDFNQEHQEYEKPFQ